MFRPPPISKLTGTLFPYTRSSDLHLAGRGVETEHQGEGRGHVQPVAVDGDSAAEQIVVLVFRRQIGAPDLASRCGVEGGDLRCGIHGEAARARSEEHTSELQSLMRNSSAVVCLKTNTH